MSLDNCQWMILKKKGQTDVPLGLVAGTGNALLDLIKSGLGAVGLGLVADLCADC